MLLNRIPLCLATCLAAAFATAAVAQDEGFPEREPITSGVSFGLGARAVAMGGAYTSVGGDYSAAFWNPATLRDIKRAEVYGSLSHLSRQNTTSPTQGVNFFSPASDENTEDFTKFNDIGVAYAVPTTQGSLVFAFGFQRIKSYDSNLGFRAFNSDPDFNASEDWHQSERGSLNAWTLAGAVDVSPNVSLGLGLNFLTGSTEYGATFREVDTEDVFQDANGEGFHSFRVENTVDTDLSGVNLKLGGQFRLNPMLTLGATVTTPTTLKGEEDWSYFDEFGFDDGFLSDSTDSGTSEYKVRSPWSFAGGASLHLLNFVFSADLEMNDWSQVEWKTDLPVAGTTKISQNQLINALYRRTVRVRLGGEFTLPFTGLSVRAGYFRDPSIFKDASNSEDRQFLSAGIGLLVDKQVRLDAAFVHGFWKDINNQQLDLGGSYNEDIKVNKLFVSMAYRF